MVQDFSIKTCGSLFLVPFLDRKEHVFINASFVTLHNRLFSGQSFCLVIAGKAQVLSITSILAPFSCLNKPSKGANGHNTRPLQLAHWNGMQPLLVLLFTPGVFLLVLKQLVDKLFSQLIENLSAKMQMIDYWSNIHWFLNVKTCIFFSVLS